MRCPKCGYMSFEYLDDCRKCEKDLTRHKKTFNIAAEKHGFINILKYVELENIPDKDYSEEEQYAVEEADYDRSSSDEEITLELEQEPELTSEPETATPDIPSFSDGFDAETSLSEETAAEEISLEEVSISIDDIDASEEEAITKEISLEQTEDQEPEQALDDDSGQVSMQLEEIDLAEEADTETAPSADQPIELEGLEIMLDPEDAGEEGNVEEIEFSLEDMDLEEDLQEIPSAVEDKPASAEPEEISAEDQEHSGELLDLSTTTADDPENLDAQIEEIKEEPAIVSDTEVSSGEDEQSTAAPVAESDDMSFDFSLDGAEISPETAEQQSDNPAVEEDDLELSLDEFDNFKIDIEDFNLDGDTPLPSEKSDADLADAEKEKKKESKRKTDEKNIDDHAIDIDLDDLYHDT